MTNDPWTIQDEKPRVYFGLVETEAEEKQGANNTYHKITVRVAPLSGGDLTERSYFSFGKDWNKIVLPSLQALVAAGKLPHASQVSGRYASYHFEPWKDYAKNTVEYYQRENVEKVQADERGNFFVEKYALFFEDVYSDEASCIVAHDNHFGVEANGNGSPWGDQSADIPAGNGNVALSFLPHFVKQALGDDHKVDRAKLAADIANNAVFSSLTVDSPEVAAEIEKVEAEAPF